MPPKARRAPKKTQAGTRRGRDADITGSSGAGPEAPINKTSKRQLRDIALLLLTRWLPEAAPLRPESPFVCRDERKSPDEKAAFSACMARSKSDMAACARIVTAAGRRGVQRLAVALIAAEKDTRFRSLIEELEHQYAALMRVLLLFAATTARTFVVQLGRTEQTTSEAQGREGNVTYADVTRAVTHFTTWRFLTIDPDTEDDNCVDGWYADASAPLDRAHLCLKSTSETASAAVILAWLVAADLGGGRREFPRLRDRPFEVARGAVTAALRPRELEMDYCHVDNLSYQYYEPKVNVADIVPWIREQRQLRILRTTVDYAHYSVAVIKALVEAEADLEELDLRLCYSFSTLGSILYQPVSSQAPSGPRTFHFPGLRILRLSDARIEGKDLRELAGAAHSIEVLALSEDDSVTADDWDHALRQMKRLHTLLILTYEPSDTLPHVPAFYRALSAPDCAPACTLRVLERRFAPDPDVMHTVLNAVALQLPHLESIRLPGEIFNALALVDDGDAMAKRDLRAAVQAATRRCKNLKLSTAPWSNARLHIKAFQELVRLLPGIQLYTAIEISSDVQVTQALRDVLARSSAAQYSRMAECGRADSQVRKLAVFGPLSREDLATVVLACPHLRALRCEYGGDLRPAVRTDEAPPPPFNASLAEAAFLDWLGAIVDVSAARAVSGQSRPQNILQLVNHDDRGDRGDGRLVPPSVSGTTPTTPPVQPQVVPSKLRRLRVAKPPFDGERQAAGMNALERVRAHSHVLIGFT